MLVATILIGFAMMTLGVALLFLGEVPFLSGKRIPAGRARWIGAIFVAFLPQALAVRQLSNAAFGSDAVQGPVVIGGLFVACLWTVFAILFRVMVPKREPREPKSAISPLEKANPFDAAPAGEVDQALPWTEPQMENKSAGKSPAPGKSGKPKAGSKDPFDFS
ncbi:MAG: hypothetical protein EXR98_08670 [Gemmataceae bacterium]|nr:hypothetical protein [Gemmataceae bacterium]